MISYSLISNSKEVPKGFDKGSKFETSKLWGIHLFQTTQFAVS